MRHTLHVLLATALVAGFQNAHAAAGDGINVGGATVRPSVSASITHDSNVGLTETGEQDDTYAEYAAQVVAELLGEKVQFRGNLWVAARDYDEFNDLDEESFGEYASILFAGPGGTSVLLTQAYREILDFDSGAVGGSMSAFEFDILGTPIDRTTRGQKKLFDASAGVERALTDKTTGRMVYSYSEVDYDGSDLDDWEENRGTLELMHQLTDKTSALLNGQYGQYSGDAAGDKPEYWRARAGVQSQQTDKMRVRALAGVQSYTRDTPTGSDDDYTLNFEVGGNWQATEKTSLAVAARNDVQPVAGGNYKDIYAASLALAHALTQDLGFSASITHRRDEWKDPLLSGGVLVPDADSEQNIGELRLDYNRNVLGLFAVARYDETRSSLGDYDEFRGTLGARLQY